jgi:Rps23 Pro-64 3,4-dihydroxylase Tpa1-like proline 4-hydroxylase
MSSGRFNTESLLLSRRVRDIAYYPFCHFRVDNYLPEEFYLALLERFPNDSYFVQEASVGNKRSFSSRRGRTPQVFHDFCVNYPLWRELFDCLTSEAFVSDLNRLVRRGLVSARGWRGLKSWRLAEKVSSGIYSKLVQPVEIAFEFSRLDPGAYILPHTDGTKKLVSLLLYFPDPKWQESFGGHTEFYRPKDPSLEKNWANRQASFLEMITFTVNTFVPNRLVGFIKSTNSYHGVPPIACPDYMTRNSLNINVNITGPAEGALGQQWPAQMLWKN